MVVREAPHGVEVVLASRRTRDGSLAWGLPKGIVEQGEAPEATAVREVQEETGLVATVRAPLGDISYWFAWDGTRVKKTVSFYLMDAVGGNTADHDHEMEEVRWFALAEARRAATFRSEREVLDRARRLLDGAR